MIKVAIGFLLLIVALCLLQAYYFGKAAHR